MQSIVFTHTLRMFACWPYLIILGKSNTRETWITRYLSRKFFCLVSYYATLNRKTPARMSTIVSVNSFISKCHLLLIWHVLASLYYTWPVIININTNFITQVDKYWLFLKHVLFYALIFNVFNAIMNIIMQWNNFVSDADVNPNRLNSLSSKASREWIRPYS